MQFPKVDKIPLTDQIVIPEMVKVRKHFAYEDLEDPVATLKEQLLALDPATIEGVRNSCSPSIPPRSRASTASASAFPPAAAACRSIRK